MIDWIEGALKMEMVKKSHDVCGISSSGSAKRLSTEIYRRCMGKTNDTTDYPGESEDVYDFV